MLLFTFCIRTHLPLNLKKFVLLMYCAYLQKICANVSLLSISKNHVCFNNISNVNPMRNQTPAVISGKTSQLMFFQKD